MVRFYLVVIKGFGSLATPQKWALAYLQLDEPGPDAPPDAPLADPPGSESVWLGESWVGSIASGGYGYSINC